MVNKKTSRPSKRLVAAVKKITIKQTEQKKYRQNPTGGNSLSNGVTIGENLMYWLGQGDSDKSRNGDKVYIDNIKLAFSLQNDANYTSSPTAIRIVIYRSSERVKSGSIAFGLGVLGVATGIATNGDFGFHDNDEVTILRDKWYNLESSFSGSVAGRVVNMNVPIKSNYQYSGDNGGYGSNKNIYMAVMAYNPVVTATFVVAELDVSYDVYFRDL